MKKAIVLIMILGVGISGFSQKYATKNGLIKFYSEAPLETIEAENKTVNAAIDINTGDIVFKVMIKSFEFEKALMQEHFNENYLNSDKFPTATFRGKVVNLDQIDLTTPGKHEAEIEGELTIKGEKQTVMEKGTLTVSDNKVYIRGESVFTISLADYKIKIPKAVVENISKSIEITVDINMKDLD